MRHLLGITVALLIVAFGLVRPALATDFYVEGAAMGGGSSWEDDPSVQGSLRTGFEFVDIVSVEATGRLGYAGVDERMLMMVGIGTKLAIPIEPVVPHLRLGAIHFHETPIAAIHDDHFMHAMGVGDGIRHRFGFEGALGVSWLFATVDDTTFLAQAEGVVDLFADDGKGPVAYGSASLGLGLQYAL